MQYLCPAASAFVPAGFLKGTSEGKKQPLCLNTHQAAQHYPNFLLVKQESQTSPQRGGHSAELTANFSNQHLAQALSLLASASSCASDFFFVSVLPAYVS